MLSDWGLGSHSVRKITAGNFCGRGLARLRSRSALSIDDEERHSACFLSEDAGSSALVVRSLLRQRVFVVAGAAYSHVAAAMIRMSNGDGPARPRYTARSPQ